MLVLHQFLTPPHDCTYLPEQVAKLAYACTARLEPQAYEDLMNRGYRKFGMTIFTPVCEQCQACRPIRVPVDRFRPDRSQRRAWKRNQHLSVRFGSPKADDAHLELYNRYHQSQTRRKGWPPHQSDADEYALSFGQSTVPSIEISVWEGGTLRGVVLTDVTPNVVSAVYHYHEPCLAAYSLGTFCVLQTFELARRLKRAWVYLGYYVAGCPSMVYKARFRPCQIMDAAGVWREEGEPIDAR